MDKIQIIEKFVKEKTKENFGHDFSHTNRVRKWALIIAQKEGYEKMDVVEATALLHDIGRIKEKKTREHAIIGAKMTSEFLENNNLFSQKEIDEIAIAVEFHNAPYDNKGKLQMIIRDSDILDLLGAVGIMRAQICQYDFEEYDPENIKGSTWNLTSKGFDHRFKKKVGIGKYIVDYINFQISCYEFIKTKTARKIGKPAMDFMRKYILQLEKEMMRN